MHNLIAKLKEERMLSRDEFEKITIKNIGLEEDASTFIK